MAKKSNQHKRGARKIAGPRSVEIGWNEDEKRRYILAGGNHDAGSNWTITLRAAYHDSAIDPRLFVGTPYSTNDWNQEWASFIFLPHDYKSGAYRVWAEMWSTQSLGAFVSGEIEVQVN